MGRKLLLGTAMVLGIVSAGDWLEAAMAKPGLPQTARAGVRFTSGWASGDPTLMAEGRGVKFYKRVGRDKVSIRVEVASDVVELEADTAGRVRIGRNRKFLQLRSGDSFDTNIAKAQKLTAGSKALDGLEGLVASLASDGSQPAQSVRSSHALLSVVRGVTVAVAGPRIPGTSPRASRAMFMKAAEGPSACWAEYETTVFQYNVQFNDCISDYWWIPGWTAACGFQFALQSELAWFWLLSCSGGMPV